MTWTVEVSRDAARQLRRLDRTAQTRIRRFMGERLATDEDPRRIEAALQGSLAGLWRYRIGDYRLICRIEDAGVLALTMVTAGC